MKKYFYYVAQASKRNFNPSINAPLIPLTLAGNVEWEGDKPFSPIALANTIATEQNLESVMVTFLFPLSEEEYNLSIK